MKEKDVKAKRSTDKIKNKCYVSIRGVYTTFVTGVSGRFMPVPLSISNSTDENNVGLNYIVDVLQYDLA